MMRLLLCVVAMGVDMSARTAEKGHLSDKVKGPTEDLQYATARSGSIEADGKRGFNRIKQDAGRYVSDAQKELNAKVSQVQRVMDATLNNIASFKEHSNNENSELMGEYRDGMNIMNKERINLKKQATYTEKMIDDTSKVQADEQAMNYNDNARDYQQVTQDIGEKIISRTENVKERLGESAEAVAEKAAEIGEDIKDTHDDDRETYADMDELSKEVEGVNTETNEMVQAVGRENAAEAQRATKDAEEAVPLITDRADKDNRVAVDEIHAITKEQAKEIKYMNKDEKTEAEEIEDMDQDKADELSGLVKETVMDTATDVNDMTREDAVLQNDDNNAQRDFDTDIKMEQASLKGLQETNANLESDSAAKLTELIDNSDASVMTAQSNLDMATTTAEQTLEGDQQAVEDSVRNDLHQQVNKVQSSIDESIGTLGKSVTTGTSNLQESITDMTAEAGDLGKIMAEDSSTIQRFNQEATETAEALTQTAGTVEGKIETSKQSALDSFADVTNQVGSKIAGADAQLIKEASQAANATTQLSGAVYRDLEEKVESLRTEATRQLDRSSRSISSASAKANDVLGNMEVTVGSIGSLKDGLEQKLPVSQSDTAMNLNGMRVMIDASDEVLKSQKNTQSNNIQDKENDAKIEFGKRLDQHSNALNNELLDSSGAIMNSMASVGMNVDGIHASAMNDYNQGIAFQTNLKRAVANSIRQTETAEEGAAGTEAELAERLRLAGTAVDAGVNQQAKDGELLKESTVSDMARARVAFEAVATARLKHALETGDSEITGLAVKSAMTLNKRLNTIEGLMGSNTGQFHALQSAFSGMSTGFQSGSIAATGQEAAALAKMAANRAQFKAIEEQMKTASESEKQLLMLQKSEIAAEQDRLINKMLADEQSRLGQFTTDTNSKFSDEKEREKALKEKEKTSVNGINSKLHNLLHEVGGAVRNTEGEVSALEKGEANIESELSTASGGIHSAVALGEDSIQRLEEGEESQMSRNQEEDLALIQTVLTGLGYTKGRAGDELHKLDEEFHDKLNAMKGVGTTEATKLTRIVAALIASNPDFADLFDKDTLQATMSIHAARDRIAHAESWATQVAGGFRERVKTTEAKDADEAAKFHSEISDNKRTVLTAAESIVDKISIIKSELHTADKDVGGSLDKFSKKLQQLGITTVHHDQAAIDQMDNQLFNLMGAHSRLVEWKDHFSHRTGAWRDEVEHKLRKLGAGLSDSESEIANQRLQEEVDANEGMRSMQLRVESEVADSNKDQAEEFNKVADNIQKRTKYAAADKAKDAQAITDAQDNARLQIERRTDQLGARLGDVGRKQDDLKSESDKLQRDVHLTKTDHDQKFGLAAVTVSDYNENTQAKYDKVNNKMNLMSFMEEGDSNLRTAVQADDLQALKSFNEELMAENSKLEKSNTKLETGLEKAHKKKALKK